MGGQDCTYHEETAGICGFHFGEMRLSVVLGGEKGMRAGLGIISDGGRGNATGFGGNLRKGTT